MRDVLVPFVVTRVMLLGAATLASRIIPQRGEHPQSTGLFVIDMWTRWDAGWYVRIAAGGYSPSEGPSTLAFFPLYPMLMRAAAAVFGRSDPAALFVAGVVISNVALLLALAFLTALVRLDFDPSTAGRTALYVLVFPTTLFLSAGYTEALFLATAVGSVYCARTERWWAAGLLGAAATLTRAQGAIVLLPLAYEYFSTHDRRLRRIDTNIVWLALIPVALGAFMAYLAVNFGDPLAFIHSAGAWGREFALPWESVQANFTRRPQGVYSFTDLAFTILFGALVVASWRLLRRSYAMYATLALLVAMSSGSLLSMPRYGLAVFPVFIVLAVAGRYSLFDRVYVIVASGAAAVLMVMFALWYWVA